MSVKIEIHQIHTDSLSCEPMLERTPNGELLCICQCGGTREPDILNRVYAFHSNDNGNSWYGKDSVYPENGQAVYCTELARLDDTLTAYLTIHSGRFVDWTCTMMQSRDNGYTWENAGSPSHFPEYTFLRAFLRTKDGRLLQPYQTYPVTEEARDRLHKLGPDASIGEDKLTPYCESGILESLDGGKTYTRHMACRMSMEDGWIWSEPTIAELSDGTIAMLLRKDRSGWLWRCDSTDGGKTWTPCEKTDIPNPTNKPRLIPMDDGRIALIHTPNNDRMKELGGWGIRSPLELWISDDDMKTWREKIRLTDFPGNFSYSDGFYENGHIRFVIEHNRHTILYFDVTL